MNLKVLVAEPEEMFAAAVAYILEQAGLEAVQAHDSRLALDQGRAMQPDLFILSAALPALSREHLCCDLIHEGVLGSNASLLLLGNDPGEEFCAAMLDCGADDYLVKPFGMQEFMARIGVLMRRFNKPIGNLQTKELRVGQFALSVGERRLLIGEGLKGRSVTVTTTEALLLQLLMEQAGQLVSHETIMERIWGDPKHSGTFLRGFLMALRRKLGEDGRNPRHLVSLHGQGLRFDP